MDAWSLVVDLRGSDLP